MAPSVNHPPVILFGYNSSPFTNKVRLALRIKQIPFCRPSFHPLPSKHAAFTQPDFSLTTFRKAYVTVPSMLPRPLITSTFGLQYRKIPILAIGREIYCDTSLIIEALEHFFPADQGWGTVYPVIDGITKWTYRGLVRGFASFWTDKPLFRTTTGFIPSAVWASDFGKDRAQLIGHPLSPEKLRSKILIHLSNLDLHLSMLEPMFQTGTWAMPTKTPSLADISLYYQLRWGIDIAAGKGISNLSGGGADDTNNDVVGEVFNEKRYPGLMRWFEAFGACIDDLSDVQTTVAEDDTRWKDTLRRTPLLCEQGLLLPTAVAQHTSLDTQRGLEPGVGVSIVPDDTGRGNPTMGTLVKAGSEEVVIKPDEKGELEVRVHFPRLGFVVQTTGASKL